MNFGLLCTIRYTVVDVNVKVALLYSTKCNQTQRGGGGVVVVWWWCGGGVSWYLPIIIPTQFKLH